MKPMARDLGGLIGMTDFHTGRTTGFPGFDVGVAVNGQFSPRSDNTILKSAGVRAFAMPMVQASVGLPYDLEVCVRGTGYAGNALVGGGVRYSLIRPDLAKFIPDLSVGVFYDSFTNDSFKMRHMSGSLIASFDLPLVKPYIGVGIDNTKLETKVSAADATVLAGDSVTDTSPRVSLGVNITPFPLTYVYGGYTWLNGSNGFQTGLGVRF